MPPTYDYQCPCGHHEEIFEKMSAKTVKKCPNCGRKELQRQIGKGAGILFKGSGFYQTDYKKKK